MYCKRPFGGPEQVIRSLGRCVHRVGISNHRSVAVTDHQVVFRTKTGEPVTLSPVEFLRRLLQHVLPERFVKIRHYGLHASGMGFSLREPLARSLHAGCVALLGMAGCIRGGAPFGKRCGTEQ